MRDATALLVTSVLALGGCGSDTDPPGSEDLDPVDPVDPVDMSSPGPVSLIAFQHADRYTGCTGAAENAVADYDGDGHDDVALACKGDGTVQVFLGRGDGTFPSTPSTTSPIAAPTGLAAVDFDGDAHVDLVVMSSDGAHLLRNDGQASFTDTATRALSGGASVRVADLDKDGVDDLVVSGSATEVRVLWGTAAAMTAFSTSAVLKVGGVPAQTIPVDLDNDGFLDLAVLETLAGKVETIHNDQSSTMRSFGSAKTIIADPSPYAAVFQDLDNDGKPEALVSNGSVNGYGFAVWSNTNGTLAPANSFSLYQRAGLRSADMLLVDIDHDQLADLVVVSENGAYVTVYRGQGPLQFDTSEKPALWAGGTAGHVHAADFDADGFEDLVLIDGDGFSVVRGAMGAKLLGPEVFSFEQTDGVFAMTVSDLDGDGDPDVSLLMGYNADAATYLDDGRGHMTFTAPVSPPDYMSCGTGAAITTGDVNADGQADVLRAELYCYDSLLGSAGVLKQGPSSAPIADTNRQVALADLDEDGKLDLVSLASGASGHATVRLGVGDGSFLAPTADLPIDSPRELQVADVNKDGHNDLVVAGSDDKISVFLNDGHAVFGAPSVVMGPMGLRAIALIDYDEDGVLDLVAAGSALYQFKGAPGFSDAQRSSRSLLSPWQHMSVGDINRDGHPDLVGSSANGIEILTGSGTSAFAAAHAFNFAQGLSAVFVSDVDGDGLSDLVISGGDGHKGAAILRNLSH